LVALMGMGTAVILEYSNTQTTRVTVREKDILRPIRAQEVEVWRPLDRTNPASRRMNFAVGRFVGKRFEAALGQEVVASAKARAAGQVKPTAAVEAIVLALSDEQMGALSRAADPMAGGAEWAEAMRVLLDCKVPKAAAGRILGIAQRSEASRLASMSAWPPALLALARKHGLTRHQMRWLEGLSVSEAAEVLTRARELDEAKADAQNPDRRKEKKVSRIGPTVASIREAAVRIEGRKARKRRAKRVTPPSPALAETSDSGTENERLSRVLGTDVRVRRQGEGYVLEAVYYSAEGLAGVLEWLGKGRGERPPDGSKRTFKLELDSLEELTYLTGTEGD
jgi:hypothetical protein